MHNFQTDWLAKWAEYTPGRMYIREHNRDISWTYNVFNKRAGVFAKFLLDERKIKEGDRIAIYSKNSSEHVLLFSACVKTGAIIVPLNFRLTPREINTLISDAQPSLFYYDAEFKDEIRKLDLPQNTVKANLSEISKFLLDNNSAAGYPQDKSFTDDHPVMILYTAGTTGLSKGVIITHRMLFWNSVNTGLRLDLTSSDHTQSFAPFFHTGGWNVLFTPFLHHGASHTLLTHFDPDLILSLMESEKATILFGVPTMLQMMADSPLFNKVDLSTVRYAIVGGAPMPIPLINKWHEKGVYIRQGYGLTEVGPNTFSLHQDDAIRKKGSIGFPNFYIDAKIVNGKGEEAGANEVGELWMRSPVVTPGYWKKENETAEAITDGWFHTGDMMRKDDEGYYYVVDRKKNMFISGGENVYPAEIESFLLTNDKVKEAAVIGVPDEKWGEVGRAFVVIKDGSDLSQEDIFDYCKGKLAKYKIPKQIVFVNELPKNDAGKTDRKKLLQLNSDSINNQSNQQ